MGREEIQGIEEREEKENVKQAKKKSEEGKRKLNQEYDEESRTEKRKCRS